MKKILLILVSTMVFGSALANINFKTKNNKVENSSETLLIQDFVLTKLKVDYGSLEIKNNIVASGNSCENACFASFQNCQAAGFSWCFRAMNRCVDACEGAGGLYN